MHMTFWWSINVGDFLFKGLTIQTAGGLTAACFVIALLSFLFEMLRFLQAKQRQKELKLRSMQLRAICPSDSANLLTAGSEPTMNTTNITLRDKTSIVAADLSLWFILQNLGYVLMLSIMIYNGWFFISAVIGGGCGYFVFGQKFMKINLQNCKIIRDTYCMQKCGEQDPEPEPSISSEYY